MTLDLWKDCIENSVKHLKYTDAQHDKKDRRKHNEERHSVTCPKRHRLENQTDFLTNRFICRDFLSARVAAKRHSSEAPERAEARKEQTMVALNARPFLRDHNGSTMSPGLCCEFGTIEEDSRRGRFADLQV